MPKERASYRAQQYRVEWERKNWAKSWLMKSSKGFSMAFCKVCDKHLKAGKSELMKHCKSSVHIANMGQVQTNNTVDWMR